MQTSDDSTAAVSGADRRTTGISRRGVLGATGALAAGLVMMPQLSPTRAAAEETEFATLRGRWTDLFLGSGFDPDTEPFATKLAAIGATAQGYLDTLAPTSGALWPDLGYADPEPDTDTESYNYSARMNTTITRLRQIAEAVRQPRTGLTATRRPPRR